MLYIHGYIYNIYIYNVIYTWLYNSTPTWLGIGSLGHFLSLGQVAPLRFALLGVVFHSDDLGFGTVGQLSLKDFTAVRNSLEFSVRFEVRFETDIYNHIYIYIQLHIYIYIIVFIYLHISSYISSGCQIERHFSRHFLGAKMLRQVFGALCYLQGLANPKLSDILFAFLLEFYGLLHTHSWSYNQPSGH